MFDDPFEPPHVPADGFSHSQNVSLSDRSSPTATAWNTATSNANTRSPGISLEESILEDLSKMTVATQKAEILQIVKNFESIHYQHSRLFQILKGKVRCSIDSWSAPELAALSHAWAQLGFKHNDLCTVMADRIVATIDECTPQELCWIWDTYASARIMIPRVAEAVNMATYKAVNNFSMEQLCSHASSYACLDWRTVGGTGGERSVENDWWRTTGGERLFERIGERLVELVSASCESQEPAATLNVHALSLAVYAFAKLDFPQHDVFNAVAAASLHVAQNFTANDIQLLMVAFAKAQNYNHELIQAMSAQALRRIAQFSAKSLTLTLRSMACFNHRDDVLLNRVVQHLPRLSPKFSSKDITTMVNVFARLQVHKPDLFEAITPMIMEQASRFSPSQWVSALQGYSSLGLRDEKFLATLGCHLQSARLTMQQLAAIMSGCASLGFSKGVEKMVEKVEHAGVQSLLVPTKIAAQMYSSLALLGYASPSMCSSSKVETLISSLSDRLGAHDIANQLDVRSCLDLCYASLMTCPRDHEPHPVDLADLLHRVEAELGASSQEDQLLLGQMQRAVEILPWNQDVVFPLHLQEWADMVDTDSGHEDVPLAYFASVIGTLAPHLPPGSLTWTNSATRDKECDGPSLSEAHGFLCGVHAAIEVRDGLKDISATLQMHGIAHTIVTDDLDVGAHIDAHMKSGEVSARFIWGSSVHYADASITIQRHLVPAAQFQVAALQTEKDIIVIVVPHWSWPMQGDLASKSRCLFNLVNQDTRIELPHPMVVTTDTLGIFPQLEIPPKH